MAEVQEIVEHPKPQKEKTAMAAAAAEGEGEGEGEDLPYVPERYREGC